jgi:Flp pilus assembly protein TadG
MITSAPISITRLLRPALRRVWHEGSNDHGAALVEFTLVIPVLLLVLMAILYVGQALNESIDETHLVNVAARYAAVNQNPGGTTLQAYIAQQGDTAALQVTNVCISFPNGTSNVGDPVQVTMSSTYNWIPLLGLGTTTWVRTATMRLEAVPTAYSATCAH